LDVGEARRLVRVAASAPFPGEVTPPESQLADAGPLWADIARKHVLVERNLSVLASAWHTDADLGRPIEVVTDMSRSRKLGFLEIRQRTTVFSISSAACAARA
jgi:hypothetical protein